MFLEVVMAFKREVRVVDDDVADLEAVSEALRSLIMAVSDMFCGLR
jgi:hypothetical protein